MEREPCSAERAIHFAERVMFRGTRTGHPLYALAADTMMQISEAHVNTIS